LTRVDASCVGLAGDSASLPLQFTTPACSPTCCRGHTRDTSDRNQTCCRASHDEMRRTFGETL